jgi:hypothetical protein
MRLADYGLRFERVLFMGAAVVALLVFGLFVMSSSALASWEGVGYFGGGPAPVLEEKFPEEDQLGGAWGVAVNVSGAGGVAPGTVYVTTSHGSETHVARYTPAPDGKLVFSEQWTVTAREEPYERCGPEGEPAHPHCSPKPYEDGSTNRTDVEVDQATGDVYVFGAFYFPDGGENEVAEYAPDGSSVIARFGTQAVAGKSVSEVPEEIHDWSANPLAVNDAGEVYISDYDAEYSRLMVFRPDSPGDYGHYVYAGEEDPLAGLGDPPLRPIVDAAGHVYVAGEEYVFEYAAGVPASYPAIPSSPVCRFELAKGGISGMTVDPVTGEVFFYDYKYPKRVYRLGRCNMETGRFAESGGELETFAVSPEEQKLEMLAFDPARQVEPSRPAGVLYGVAQSIAPSSATEPDDQSALGYVFERARELPPVVAGESVAHVGVSSAVLHASVNTNNYETHYVFQYLPESVYEANPVGERFAGAMQAPGGGGVISSGQGVDSVAATLSGLTAGAGYRYRVVATSRCSSSEPGKTCEGAGEAQSFRTFSVEPGGLPDGRAYELVSPARKLGDVFPADPGVSSCGSFECKPGFGKERFPMQSSPDGETVVYEGLAFSEGEGVPLENQYLSRRDATGWQTVDLSPGQQGKGNEQGYKAFDTALTRGVLQQISPVLDPQAPVDEAGNGFANLYAQPVDDLSSFSPLLTEAPRDRPASSFVVRYAGASANVSRVFFEANDALTEETPVAPAALDGGVLEYNLYEWSAAGGLRLVNVDPGNTLTEPGAAFGASEGVQGDAISQDGSRAFWSSPTGRVYVRIDGERTVKVEDPGHFLSASTDGSRVLLDDGCIYVLAEEGCEDLTLDEAGIHQGGLQGIAGQSDDLSHVYFVDTKTLTGENAEHRSPNEHGSAEDNLYAWERGGGTRFVATLLPANGIGSKGGDWTPSPETRTAEASRDGGWLAFMSQASLTGYDNTGPCDGSRCEEAFLYDASAGRVVCVSCDPTGARPLGATTLRRIDTTPPFLPQPRYLTDAGRLFFDSENSLVPADTNGGVEDVYEYEPDGVGSCPGPGGCVFLISAGTGGSDSNFMMMDETGKDVFFTTRDRLVHADRDELFDLYDAREGGGHFASAPSPGTGGCGGELCPSPSSGGGGETPSSLSFQGPGNVSLFPPAGTGSKPQSRTLSRAQQLTRALRACRKKPKRKRVACERAAHRKYAKQARAKQAVRASRRHSNDGRADR